MKTLWGLFLLALTVAGCSGERVLKVSGTVTRAGKPVPDLVVIFTPEQGRPSRGLTDEKGQYTLRFTRQSEGALAGRHKIWVQLRPVSPKDGQELCQRILQLQQDTEIEKILEKYGEATTPLTKDVTQNGQVIDLQLD